MCGGENWLLIVLVLSLKLTFSNNNRGPGQ